MRSRLACLAVATFAAGALACGREAPASIVVPTLVGPQPSASVSAIAAVDDAKPFADGELFKLSFEQDGREIERDGDRVRLEKRPFVLIVRMSEPGAVMVNVSMRARLFLLSFGASANKEDLDGVFGPGHGMAENDPPDRDLIFSDDGAHYLFYQSDSANRCHEVRHEGTVIVCRRYVDAFSTDGRAVRVEATRVPEVYIVAVKRDASGETDLQRARARIVFH